MNLENIFVIFLAPVLHTYFGKQIGQEAVQPREGAGFMHKLLRRGHLDQLGFFRFFNSHRNHRQLLVRAQHLAHLFHRVFPFVLGPAIGQDDHNVFGVGPVAVFFREFDFVCVSLKNLKKWNEIPKIWNEISKLERNYKIGKKIQNGNEIPKLEWNSKIGMKFQNWNEIPKLE